MKKLSINFLLLTTGILSYASAGFGHSTGDHAGGVLQQLMHIIQSADHLFIILALAVAVSLLIRQAKSKRN